MRGQLAIAVICAVSSASASLLRLSLENKHWRDWTFVISFGLLSLWYLWRALRLISQRTP